MGGSLRHEIKQTKPFPSLADEVMLNVHRTSDWLMRRFSVVLKPFGLSPTQYNALRILRGSRPAGLTCRDVADRMITRDPDITRLLDRLERSGLVTRSRDPGDRRVITARVSPAGLRLLEQLDPVVDSWARTALAHIGRAKLRQLNSLLEEARNG